MVDNDVQLIRRILSGDDEAFGILIQKYRKGVHALVWRKIGDFHYAEEITQDVFLQVYQKLSTLKNPSQFAGWLYVIVDRLCINWLQRHKPAEQSLEATSIREIEEFSYACYVSGQRETEALERRYAVVKKLLEKLPESERTVVTLYYLGEMTTKEIGKFLGVSVNTIKSRLRRARKRLLDDQELFVQKVLGGVQLSENLTSHIMRQIADMKPIPPPAAKPLLPWIAFGTATLLITLLLGASQPYLTRFQQPYSFEAESEPTIEIIDVPFTLNIDSKPSVRNQVGSAVSPGKNNSAGLQSSEAHLTTATETDAPAKFSTAQWTQASGPQGTPIFDTFAASDGTLYIDTQTGIYRLTADTPAWTRINANIPTPGGYMSMAEHSGTLYIVSDDEIFTSSDDGETWDVFCPRPEGDHHVGLIVTDAPQITPSRTGIAMYLAFRDEGIFRSTDAGTRWNSFNEGLSGKRIRAVAEIGSVVFAGTNRGLYRLGADRWEQVPVETFKTPRSFETEAFADVDSGFYRLNAERWEQVPVQFSNAIHFLKVFENNLYVGVGSDLSMWRSPETKRGIIVNPKALRGAIFHSADLGKSWTEITPKNEPLFFTAGTGMEFWAAGETLVLNGSEQFRSTDAGKTWTKLGVNTRSLTGLNSRHIGVNGRTFYAVGTNGIYRTIDTGESWHPFMDGIIGTRIGSLVPFNNRLYAYTYGDIVQSTDAGESWKSVLMDSKSTGEEKSPVDFSSNSNLVVAEGELYAIASEKENLRIYRLSTDANVFAPVQGIPAFHTEILSTELWKSITEAKYFSFFDDVEMDSRLMKALRSAATRATTGGFAISDGTFYVEYQRVLFKLKTGDSEWTNTGLIDLTERSSRGTPWRQGFRLAASGETVYVGKRDGTLFQSLDEGDSWRDITPNLPLHFTRFKEIAFVGSNVYVATDKGVLRSQTGEHWRVLTDSAGMRPIIDRFAVDGTTIYGAGDIGVYHLDTRSQWKQISSEALGEVVSLAVNNDKLYSAIEDRGIFHISLEGE
jgi:RNA polymerase sigma factor (sigma-70 family)